MRFLFEAGFEIAYMSPNDPLGCLETDWREYLQDRGHRICRTPPRMSVVRSRNGRKARYRWLLLVGQGLKRVLGKSELSSIRQHVEQAKSLREATYLVVGFVQEPQRIIVLPAEAALGDRCVYSDKGGIAWHHQDCRSLQKGQDE